MPTSLAPTAVAAPPLACTRAANLMEVCGTHSHAIARHGIKQLLPPGVRMLSGPGCPVCVTPLGDLDLAIALAGRPGVILTTFGDMMRVPGSRSSLSLEKAAGRDVRIVYSPLEAVALAQREPAAQVVFVGVGFETTTPMVAAAVLQARGLGLGNFSVICAHKTIPAALAALLSSEDVRIDGFLCPGHVSTIIGLAPYEHVAREYGVPCVVAGFEPDEIMAGLRLLLAQLDAGVARAENAYPRFVKPAGNPRAQATVAEVFAPADAVWRGIGVIPGSGLKFREAFVGFDAERRFAVELPPVAENIACRCGAILRGALAPPECPLFGTACLPGSPVGPCMVSSEGACAAAFRYERSAP